MKKVLLIIGLVLSLVLFSGCGADKISDIKSEDYIGKEVVVKGIVTDSFKLFGFSGYIVEDKTDNIGVAAERLPAKGDKVTVKGTLMKDTVLGYYIKAEE